MILLENKQRMQFWFSMNLFFLQKYIGQIMQEVKIKSMDMNEVFNFHTTDFEKIMKLS